MRLLSLTIPEIEEEIEKMDRDSKALKKELFKMSWFMRGGLSFTEAYMLDYHDREIISKIIEENLEVSKESQMPFF
jgi:hypothetical protein